MACGRFASIFREMPSLQRLMFWNVKDHSSDFQKNYLALFKAIRDDIRASAPNRRLWVSRDDVPFFPLAKIDSVELKPITFCNRLPIKSRPKLSEQLFFISM